ncbi:MAG TPA: MFS transporter, partial [Candidatus Brocadiia bacterium]|nr:MFS transporter [Candidatus Brocadiia bacterium]
LVATLLVLWGVRENFERPVVSPSRADKRAKRSGLRAGAPILLLLMAMGLVRQFDVPMLPFLVQLVHGGVQGAELWMSRVQIMFAMGALAGSFLLGWLADRIAPPKVAKFCSLAAGLCVIPQMLAATFAPLLWGRLWMAFFAGGLDPVFQIWLSRVTPKAQRGQAFGWAVTARSFGWVLGPSMSTWIAIHFDVRTSFFAMSELYILLIPLIAYVSALVVHPGTQGAVEKKPAQDRV